MGTRSTFALFPLLFLIGCESVDTPAPEKRWHLSSYYGMKSKNNGLGNSFLIKEADPKRTQRYTKVYVEDVKVYPTKGLKPNQKSASRAEAEKLAEKYEDILEAEFGRHYDVVKYRGYNTLAVRAALTELRPSNPALFAVNYMPYAAAVATGSYLVTGETLGAGSTTMEAEVVDARSRRQLYAMVDQMKGSRLQPAGLDKWGQSEAAMRAWARQIRRGVQAKVPKATSSTSSQKTSSADRMKEAKKKAAAKKKASSSSTKKEPKPLFQSKKKKD